MKTSNPDLSTSWLGLELPHPLVVSPGPWTRQIDGFHELTEAGAAAIVMHSLFEEEINDEGRWVDQVIQSGSESYSEATSYISEPQGEFPVGPEAWLDLLTRAINEISVPVIASLNGVTPGGWKDLAQRIEQAGAKALELNLYQVPVDVTRDSVAVEKDYLLTVEEVLDQVSIPVSVKLSPFLSSPGNFIKQLQDIGVAGVVLFNRFYQPDIDLESLSIVPHLELSQPVDMQLPLRWTALLSGELDLDMAISSGVHDAAQVLKGVMAGANVTMMTSELLRNGLGRLKEIEKDLVEWMTENEYRSITQAHRSMCQRHVPDPGAYVRANYNRTLRSWHQI